MDPPADLTQGSTLDIFFALQIDQVITLKHNFN